MQKADEYLLGIAHMSLMTPSSFDKYMPRKQINMSYPLCQGQVPGSD